MASVPGRTVRPRPRVARRRRSAGRTSTNPARIIATRVKWFRRRIDLEASEMHRARRPCIGCGSHGSRSSSTFTALPESGLSDYRSMDRVAGRCGRKLRSVKLGSRTFGLPASGFRRRLDSSACGSIIRPHLNRKQHASPVTRIRHRCLDRGAVQGRGVRCAQCRSADFRSTHSIDNR